MPTNGGKLLRSFFRSRRTRATNAGGYSLGWPQMVVSPCLCLVCYSCFVGCPVKFKEKETCKQLLLAKETGAWNYTLFLNFGVDTKIDNLEFHVSSLWRSNFHPKDWLFFKEEVPVNLSSPFLFRYFLVVVEDFLTFPALPERVPKSNRQIPLAVDQILVSLKFGWL